MQQAKISAGLGLVNYAAALQERHELRTTADARKERGQVFEKNVATH